MRHRRHNMVEPREGAAATELAIALPFLALVFMAGLDFARIYHTTQTLENCACAGAMYASGAAKIAPTSATAGITEQDRTNAAVVAVLAEATSLNPAIDSARIQVSQADGIVTVTVNYDFPTITPILSSSRIVSLTRAVKMKQLY